jgi:hypothetical protein
MAPESNVMASVLTFIPGDEIRASVVDATHVRKALEHANPGRYMIEEGSMAGELLPSAYRCQRWGVAIRKAGGSVMIEREPARRGNRLRPPAAISP